MYDVMGTDLDQELVPPPIQRLETLARIHIVDQHATVRSSVKGHPERLETFLTGRVPQLHGHDSVVHHEFSGEEVGAWFRFGVKGVLFSEAGYDDKYVEI